MRTLIGMIRVPVTKYLEVERDGTLRITLIAMSLDLLENRIYLRDFDTIKEYFDYFWTIF